MHACVYLCISVGFVSVSVCIRECMSVGDVYSYSCVSVCMYVCLCVCVCRLYMCVSKKGFSTLESQQSGRERQRGVG